MFTLNEQTSNGFQTLVLKNDQSGVAASVVPSCGGILLNFTIPHLGKDFNVIDSYDSLEDFKANLTAKGFKGSKLSPFVCRLKNGSYHFGKDDHKIEKFYLKEHAIHGLLFDRSFLVTNHVANEEFVEVNMQYSYNKDDKGYPFNYKCDISYKLNKEDLLTVTTTITNTDEGLIPIQDGWHPYFQLDDKLDDLQLEFQSSKIVEFDSDLLPTGIFKPYQEYGSLKLIAADTFDNCFQLDFTECQPLCVIRNPEKKIQLEIYPDASYPYLQVYTPPHRNSIAIENLSSPPDAFNNNIDLKTISPNQKAVFSTSFKISILP